MKTYTTITARDQVTEEVLELVRNIESGWYADKAIDWEDVWDRLEGCRLEDGTYIDMGTEADSGAMRKIRQTIRNERRYG